MKTYRRLTACLAVCATLGSPALCQWSTDASNNLSLADRTGEQTQPKIIPLEDCGCYESWFDSDPLGSPAFGYDVYLQRLDGAGRELWSHNGIHLADRGFSSTVDYDLCVDAAGNALVGISLTNTSDFLKVRSPSRSPRAQRVHFLATSRDFSFFAGLEIGVQGAILSARLHLFNAIDLTPGF